MIAAVILPDRMLLAEAAQMAVTSRLFLVITRNGTVVLTPVLLPGMQRIAVSTEQPKQEACNG